MTARRYAHGDRVFVVIEATAGFSADQTGDEIEVQYETDLGPCEIKVALDSDAVRVYSAAWVTTEYGVRVESRNGRQMSFPLRDEDDQREYIAHVPDDLRSVALSRPVLPWTESDR